MGNQPKADEWRIGRQEEWTNEDHFLFVTHEIYINLFVTHIFGNLEHKLVCVPSVEHKVVCVPNNGKS